MALVQTAPGSLTGTGDRGRDGGRDPRRPGKGIGGPQGHYSEEQTFYERMIEHARNIFRKNSEMRHSSQQRNGNVAGMRDWLWRTLTTNWDSGHGSKTMQEIVDLWGHHIGIRAGRAFFIENFGPNLTVESFEGRLWEWFGTFNESNVEQIIAMLVYIFGVEQEEPCENCANVIGNTRARPFNPNCVILNTPPSITRDEVMAGGKCSNCIAQHKTCSKAREAALEKGTAISPAKRGQYRREAEMDRYKRLKRAQGQKMRTEAYQQANRRSVPLLSLTPQGKMRIHGEQRDFDFDLNARGMFGAAMQLLEAELRLGHRTPNQSRISDFELESGSNASQVSRSPSVDRSIDSPPFEDFSKGRKGVQIADRTRSKAPGHYEDDSGSDQLNKPGTHSRESSTSSMETPLRKKAMALRPASIDTGRAAWDQPYGQYAAVRGQRESSSPNPPSRTFLPLHRLFRPPTAQNQPSNSPGRSSVTPVPPSPARTAIQGSLTPTGAIGGLSLTTPSPVMANRRLPRPIPRIPDSEDEEEEISDEDALPSIESSSQPPATSPKRRKRSRSRKNRQKRGGAGKGDQG